MTLVGFKSISAILILAITLLSGLFTLQITNSRQRLMQLIDACANGIFIGAALFHLLPDASGGLKTLGYHHSYLFALAIGAIGFLFLNSLEKWSLGKTKQPFYRAARISTIILLTILTIHALLTGATLGITNTLSASWVILIAIAAHKGCESFALISNMRKASYQPLSLSLSLIAFAFVTPIGVLLGGLANMSLPFYSSHVASAYFSAFAAGTFIYLGTKHSLHTNHGCNDSYSQWQQLLASLSGVTAMGLIAVFA